MWCSNRFINKSVTRWNSRWRNSVIRRLISHMVRSHSICKGRWCTINSGIRRANTLQTKRNCGLSNS